MQLNYTQDPAVGFPGQPADDGFKDDGRAVVEETNGIEPGLVVMRGTGGAKTARLPPAVAADVDAIIATFATSGAEQVLDTAGELDGVIGLGQISPPSRIDFALNSSADWDATTMVVVYKDENGVERTENLSIPDGGNTTLTTTGFAKYVKSVTVPAQSGAGGSMTAGVGAAANRTLDGGDVLGVSVRRHKARLDFSAVDAELHEDESVMGVRRKGRILVTVENAFEAGDHPLVRVVADGAEKRGAIRVGDSDSGDCIPWTKARLMSTGGAGEVGVLEVNL